MRGFHRQFRCLASPPEHHKQALNWKEMSRSARDSADARRRIAEDLWRDKELRAAFASLAPDSLCSSDCIVTTRERWRRAQTRLLPASQGRFLVMIHSALNTINYSYSGFFLKPKTCACACVCLCFFYTFRSPTINNEILLTHTLTVLSHTDLGSKTKKTHKYCKWAALKCQKRLHDI